MTENCQDPNIINNQGSNLTKTLYALKGVAQDFKDLRVKSGEGGRGVVGRWLARLHGGGGRLQPLSCLWNRVLWKRCTPGQGMKY